MWRAEERWRRQHNGGSAVVRDDERETERKRRGGDYAAELLGPRNTIRSRIIGIRSQYKEREEAAPISKQQ